MFHKVVKLMVNGWKHLNGKIISKYENDNLPKICLKQVYATPFKKTHPYIILPPTLNNLMDSLLLSREAITIHFPSP